MEETSDIEMELTEEQKMNTGPPLFLKKLWKMVNDEEAEHIICWNETENGFIILDQYEFATKLLPQYFRHNNMSSFIRQLNFYNFHKVPSTTQAIEFAHGCFLKGVPELLVLIKRKNTGVKPKVNWNEDLKDFLGDVKKLQNKNAVINKELKLLKQENMTLWSELSSLRLRYDKQSSIINKLINFLISYIHTHRTSYTKENMGDPRSNQSNIKASPKLLELDYNDKKILDDKDESYIFEPGASNSHGAITYSVKIPDNLLRNNKNMQSLQDILSQNHIHNDKLRFPMKLNASSDGLTYSINLPADESGKMVSTDIQESLFELLRENERLSIENPSQEILTEIDKVDQPMEHLSVQYNEPAQEFEPAFANSTGNSYYTVSYPKELMKNIQPQRETPVITPLVQSPPADISVGNSSLGSPPEFSKIPNMNNNNKPLIKPKPIVCNTDHNYVHPFHSERRNPNQTPTELHSSISTSTKIVNNNESKTSLSRTALTNPTIAVGGSKMNKSLLKNKISSSYNSLGMQIGNSMVVSSTNLDEPDFSPQENVQSSSPIIEMPPEVEIEYIVEAPDSNSNPVCEVMEYYDAPDAAPSEFQNKMKQVLQHSIDQSIISPVSVGSEKYNISSTPNPQIGLKGRNMTIQKNTTNLPKTRAAKINCHMQDSSLPTMQEENIHKTIENDRLGTAYKIIVSSPNNYEFTRNIESSSLKNGKQMLPIVNASSEIGSEYIVQAHGINEDQGIHVIENAEALDENLDELLDTMVPRVENSIRKSVPPMSSVLPKKINTLSNPNMPGKVVHRDGSANSYPVKTKLSLSGSELQKLKNVRMKMVKVPRNELKYKMKPAKYPSAAGSEATLKSLKIRDTKSAGIDVRMKESLLEILKEQQSLSGESPNENSLTHPSNARLGKNPKVLSQANVDQFLPVVEMPAEEEILHQPNSNWNPANMEMEYTPEFPDDNFVLLDSLEPVVQDKVSKESKLPPLVSIGTNISETESISRNPDTNKARVNTAYPKKLVRSGSKSQDQSIPKLQMSQAIPRGKRNTVSSRKRNNPASSSDMHSFKIPKTDFQTVSPITKTGSNSLQELDDTRETNIDEKARALKSTMSGSSAESLPPTSAASKEFNILENTNSETSQEDLKILEEILNTLESKDLSDILSTDLNIDNLDCLAEENPTYTNICQDNSNAHVEANSVLDSTESVDQYFSPNFFDQNV